MSMRSTDFASLAARLRHAADTVAGWATTADAVTTAQPSHIPPEIVKGAARPVEAVVLARDDSGVAPALARARAAVIQAILHAEHGTSAAREAVRSAADPRLDNTHSPHWQ